MKRRKTLTENYGAYCIAEKMREMDKLLDGLILEIDEAEEQKISGSEEQNEKEWNMVRRGLQIRNRALRSVMDG